MAIRGKGCFVGWYDIQPGHENDHDHWHTHEHMIERVAIPGFQHGFRYRALDDGPRYCVIYQVEALSTLNSPAYLERLNNPTPWSDRVLRQFVGMNRTMCSVAASFGLGLGRYLLTIQLSADTGRGGELQDWLVNQTLPDLAGQAGLTGAHFLVGDEAVSQTPTAEKGLRGEPDKVADWVVLVQGYDQQSITQVAEGPLGADALIANGASANRLTGLYALDFALGEREAKTAWQRP